MAYVDMGTVSARGQIAIPQAIRKKMDIKDGEKVLMMLQDRTLVLKKVSDVSWAQITAPLRKAKKKVNENEVNALIHGLRKNETNRA
ncbi:AbrB/MazE/SpoVT family DNA-binding domain-containing protein [Candidatus Micrarchaeota archaeon]|nr:AbrB/MazE/SpoVT family DNA-binding domain-containing protein [Candidatus Micrarchaeota archaeon]